MSNLPLEITHDAGIRYTLRNTGDVTLEGITVHKPSAGFLKGEVRDVTLSPGQSVALFYSGGMQGGSSHELPISWSVQLTPVYVPLPAKRP